MIRDLRIVCVLLFPLVSSGCSANTQSSQPVSMLSDPTMDVAGHKGKVVSLVFGGHSKLLVSSGSDGLVRFWNIGKATEQRKLLVEKSGNDAVLAFLSTTKTLVAGTTDRRLVVIDAATAAIQKQVWTNHLMALVSVAVSSDRKWIVAAGGSGDNVPSVWDLSTLIQVGDLQGHTNHVECVAFSPDAKKIATASLDKSIKLWDSESQRELATLQGHKYPVWCVAWSQDGKYIVGGDVGPTIILWDAISLQRIQSLSWEELQMINSLVISPDCRFVVVGCGEGLGPPGALIVWEIGANKKERKYYPHLTGITSLAFSSDGQLLATGGYDGNVRVWDFQKMLRQ